MIIPQKLFKSRTNIFRILFCGVIFCFNCSVANSQTQIQKYQVEKVSFQYKTNYKGDDRCLKWFPLSPKEKYPLQYDEKGEPYLMVSLKARVEGDCAVNFEPAELVQESPSLNPNHLSFTVRVVPPVTLIKVEGPNFKDDLVIEAPLKKFEDLGFFTFFSKSHVHFETRYSQLITDNPEAVSNSAVLNGKIPLIPVFGGFLALPFPYIPGVFAGFGMYQSLGNFLNQGTVPIQMSEIAFDLRYSWTGQESWGRPTFALVGDYRGKNLYQRALSESDKPFLSGAITLAGFGTDISWFFGGVMAPWESFWSRFGTRVAWRLYLPYNLGGTQVSGNLIDVCLDYRISDKWAVGLGYSRAGTSLISPLLENATINESMTSYFFRLSLVPFIKTAKDSRGTR